MFNTEQTSTRINYNSITQCNQLFELSLSTTIQHANYKEIVTSQKTTFETKLTIMH